MMRSVAETEIGEDTGDSGRLGDLYGQYAPDAARLAYLLTGDRALAEDLVQDAFVRMFARFRDLRNPDAFAPYLRRTVVNLSHSYFRRKRVERAYLERQAAAPSREIPDVGAREEMWQSLLRLPERQRTAIVLRYYEDLSESETADAMRCPVGTVKSLVFRGIEGLRREMARDE
jgi:RNA polymerase sigma-70 factor (sigma-E family)